MKKIVRREKFNTNNAWGFGGGIGEQIFFDDGSRIRKGRAYFRHLPSEPFCRFFDANNKEVSKAEFGDFEKPKKSV